MKTQAVIYCRVSSKKQIKGTGLERQETTCRAFAKGHGYDVATVYREAWTGSEIKRPILTDMLAALLSNDIRVIIIECMDRLARDTIFQLELVARFSRSKIKLYNAMTSCDVVAQYKNDPMTRAMISVQAVFAELEKNLLVARMKRGREIIRASTGRCEGRKRYGVNSNEAAIVQKIKLYNRKPKLAPRRSPYAIAQCLNYDGLKTRCGGKWTTAHIKSILSHI